MKVNHGMIDMKGISITIDNQESYIKILPEEDFDKWFHEEEIPKGTLFKFFQQNVSIHDGDGTIGEIFFDSITYRQLTALYVDYRRFKNGGMEKMKENKSYTIYQIILDSIC